VEPFEERLQAEAARHAVQWAAEERQMAAASARRTQMEDENERTVRAFLAAMATAGLKADRWRIRSRTLDNHVHRQRSRRGWPFMADGMPYFVTHDGHVYTASRVKPGGHWSRTITGLAGADDGLHPYASGLANVYRALSGGRAIPTINGDWL
jgi:hypothetical protein